MVYLTEVEKSIMLICPDTNSFGNDRKGTHITKGDYEKLVAYSKSLIDYKENVMLALIKENLK